MTKEKLSITFERSSTFFLSRQVYSGGIMDGLTFSFLLFCLSLLIYCPRSAGLDCVHLPPIPLHGKFTLAGWFVATLTCPQKDMDFALNSPGDHGVMICDPHSTFNYDLEEIRRPQCNKRVIPRDISMPVLLAYTVTNCTGQAAEQTQVEIRGLLQQVFMDVNSPCGEQQYPCLADVQFTCGENLAFSFSPLKFQLEARFHLTTTFVPHRGLDFYSSVIQKVRSRVGEAREGRLALKNPSVWTVSGDARLVHLRVMSWSASCKSQPFSVGTDLEQDGMLTCRGCSRKYVLHGKICLPCHYQTYTPGPFYRSCLSCPPEEEWTNREEMLDLCYYRP